MTEEKKTFSSLTPGEYWFDSFSIIISLNVEQRFCSLNNTKHPLVQMYLNKLYYLYISGKNVSSFQSIVEPEI